MHAQQQHHSWHVMLWAGDWIRLVPVWHWDIHNNQGHWPTEVSKMSCCILRFTTSALQSEQLHPCNILLRSCLLQNNIAKHDRKGEQLMLTQHTYCSTLWHLFSPMGWDVLKKQLPHVLHGLTCLVRYLIWLVVHGRMQTLNDILAFVWTKNTKHLQALHTFDSTVL